MNDEWGIGIIYLIDHRSSFILHRSSL